MAMVAIQSPARLTVTRRQEARVEAQSQRTQREQLLKKVVAGVVATNRAFKKLLEFEAQHGREVETLLDEAQQYAQSA